MAGQNDKFANVITMEVETSAANTLTFEEVQIGLSLFDKTGILLSRIEYEPFNSAFAQMTATTDSIFIGVTTSNQLSELNPDQAAVVDRYMVQRQDLGAAATGALINTPFVKDLSTLPGGGILITPKPWYIGITSTGLAATCKAYVRFYFTIMKLSPQDYFELLETRNFFG